MYVCVYIYIYVCVCVCVRARAHATYGTSVAMRCWSVFCLYVRCDIYGKVMKIYSSSAVFAAPPIDTHTIIFYLHPRGEIERGFSTLFLRPLH